MEIDLQYLVENFGAPAECPVCGAKLVIDNIDVVCPNPNCKAKLLNSLCVFLKNLNVKHVDALMLEKFGVIDIPSMLAFTPDKKYKLQTKFIDELTAKFFSLSEEKLFCAMPMKTLSEKLLGKIIDFYGWKTLRDTWKSGGLTFEFLSAKGLPSGIGEITLAKFVEQAPANFSNLEKIVSDPRYCGGFEELKPVKVKIGSVCFTGALNSMGRMEAAKLAESAGFEVKSGVSRGLTYLVTNNTDSGSSKNKKAKELGTKIINEEEFLKLVNEKKTMQSIDDI